MENAELLKKINRTKIQKALFWNVKQCLLHAQTVPFAAPRCVYCKPLTMKPLQSKKCFAEWLRLRMAVRWLNAGLVHRGSGECCRACCDPFRKERADQCPNPGGA